MAVLFLLLIVQYISLDATQHSPGATRAILIPYFYRAALLVIIITPILTMGILSNERREGRLSFMFSAPISAFDIVAGKLLGVLSITGVLWILMGVIPLTLLWGAPIDMGVYCTNMLGLALFIGLHCCLGLMTSAMTRQPVIAGLGALVVSVSLWLADWGQRLDPAADALSTISTLGRLRGFLLGFINSADVVYFLIVAALFALTAMWLIESERRYA